MCRLVFVERGLGLRCINDGHGKSVTSLTLINIVILINIFPVLYLREIMLWAGIAQSV
jgi:hypothetical protein